MIINTKTNHDHNLQNRNQDQSSPPNEDYEPLSLDLDHNLLRTEEHAAQEFKNNKMKFSSIL